jgi:hypothetical protein
MALYLFASQRSPLQTLRSASATPSLAINLIVPARSHTLAIAVALQTDLFSIVIDGGIHGSKEEVAYRKEGQEEGIQEKGPRTQASSEEKEEGSGKEIQGQGRRPNPRQRRRPNQRPR